MQVNNHGGGCCGVKEISGFDGATPQDLARAIAQVNEPDNNNRLMVAILSERQISQGGMPAGRRGMDHHITQATRDAGGWSAVLADSGFILTRRFRNSNSGQNCYVFHKINRELPLDRDLPFDWRGAANGGVVAADARPLFGNTDAIARGMPVQYANRNGARYGQTGVVEVVNRATHEIAVRFNADGQLGAYAATSFRPAPPAAVAAAAAQQPPQAPPRVVHTEYFAVFQNGNERGVFETLNDLERAYPRVLRYRLRQVYSNGRIEMGDPQRLNRR